MNFFCTSKSWIFVHSVWTYLCIRFERTCTSTVNVLCTSFSVYLYYVCMFIMYSLFCIQCTPFSVYSVLTVLCTMYALSLCTLYTLFTVICTPWSIYSVLHVFYTLYFHVSDELFHVTANIWRVSVGVRLRRIRHHRRNSVDELWRLRTLTPRGWVRLYVAVAATEDEAKTLDHGKIITCIYNLGFRVGVTNKPVHI